MTQQSINISTFESQSKQNKKSCGNKKAYIIGLVLVCLCILIGLLVALLPAESENPDKGEPIPDGIRLPGTLTPISYKIQIQAFIHGNYSTNGHVDITFEVNKPTSYIIFHMLDIITINETIKLSSLSDPEEDLKFKEHSYDVERQFYIGTLTAPLKVNNTYTISLDYIGYLNTVLDGFYRSVYDKNGQETYLASTQFEATDARKAFPCFDEPSLKATFEISLARETGMDAISNMPKEDSKPIVDQNGWFWDKFLITMPMSTYLVAFTISDFEKKESTENDHVLFRVWTRADVIDQATYALDIGPKILTFYEQYFNIPFPLPKQDMLAIPDFKAGAMENWGLIIYRENALLYDSKVSSESNKQRVGVVVAHELAHQWFGDLVTPAWWSEIWLNEGFATYMEYIGLDYAEPSFKMNDQFVVEELQIALSRDCFTTSHPISVEVENPDEINELFDSISYSKGASIIRMMKYYLTEVTFQKGLTNYLNDLKYSSAVQDDLWTHMTEQAHADGTLDEDLTVKEIMDTWTLQMGYPVVTVTRDDDTAKVTQEHFLLNKSKDSSDTHDYSWWIPLTYFTKDTVSQGIEWMNPTEKEKVLSGLPTKDNWVIFNVEETGYYRVNYDIENWKAIEKQLKDDLRVIGLLNRAQIIDDTLNLARGDLLDYTTALDITMFLENEMEYISWSSAMNNLHYLEDMFTRTSGYGPLKDFLLQLATPLYQGVGFLEDPNDKHLDHLKRADALSWMCNLRYADCLINSVNLYQDSMTSNDLSKISLNLKSTVFCYGIAEGGETEWDFAWEAYLTSNIASEKDSFMAGMGCSKIPWILQRYLDLTFMEGSAIRMQDAATVFNAVTRNDYGRDIAWNYLKTHWDEMAAYYGSAVKLGGYVTAVSRSFNTEEDLKEVSLDDQPDLIYWKI